MRLLAVSAILTGILVAACTTDRASSGTKPAADAASPTGTSTPGSTTTATATTKKAGLKGLADLHVHMMAEEAFGGGWFHGSYDAAPVDCDGGFPPSDHARVKQDLTSLLQACPAESIIPWSDGGFVSELFGVSGAAASEFIGKIEGTEGDTGLHLGRMHASTGFPRWDTIAHHQAWESWLADAHAKGLSLMVMSAVTFQFLCELMPDRNRTRACDESADIDAQLAKTHDFVARNAWAEIALTPDDARRIIGTGKLAVVISVEASGLFEKSADWRPEFEHLWSQGVRTLQIAHQLDNRFIGAALHNPIFHVAEYLKTCHIDTDCGKTVGNVTLGFDVDANCKNVRGLTADGADFAREMMKRGMPIDVAHVSERGTADLFAVAQQNRYYPLYVSHGHFREVMNPELAATEKTTPAEIVRMVRQTGGLVGLRTFHDETREYTRSGVPNDCHGSTKSFAQAFEFGVKELKVGLALGSDFNGFIQQTRPRFGPNGACSAGFADEASAQAGTQTHRVGTDFDEKGLAHIGLVPDMLADLRNLGVDTSTLDDSAERYIAMWERASAARTGPADEAADLTTDGVAPYVPKDVRKQQY